MTALNRQKSAAIRSCVLSEVTSQALLLDEIENWKILINKFENASGGLDKKVDAFQMAIWY